MPEIDEKIETEAIMTVIAEESIAFWNKDFEAWAACWHHVPYVRRLGWWARGGVTVVEGWDALRERVRQVMIDNPEPNPTAANVRRENVNISITPQMAWLTFDQYAEDTGDLDMDMPGLSRETRVMEKIDGQWKIVYINWLLEE